MAKASINTNPVANRYAGSNEKIIEYSSPNGGGLIAFTVQHDGILRVDLYRHDPTVTIQVGNPDA